LWTRALFLKRGEGAWEEAQAISATSIVAMGEIFRGSLGREPRRQDRQSHSSAREPESQSQSQSSAREPESQSQRARPESKASEP
jgi:hypothetical protein